MKENMLKEKKCLSDAQETQHKTVENDKDNPGFKM